MIVERYEAERDRTGRLPHSRYRRVGVDRRGRPVLFTVSAGPNADRLELPSAVEELLLPIHGL